MGKRIYEYCYVNIHLHGLRFEFVCYTRILHVREISGFSGIEVYFDARCIRAIISRYHWESSRVEASNLTKIDRVSRDGVEFNRDRSIPFRARRALSFSRSLGRR